MGEKLRAEVLESRFAFLGLSLVLLRSPAKIELSEDGCRDGIFTEGCKAAEKSIQQTPNRPHIRSRRQPPPRLATLTSETEAQK